MKKLARKNNWKTGASGQLGVKKSPLAGDFLFSECRYNRGIVLREPEGR